MGWQDRPYNQDSNSGIPPVVFKMPPFTPLIATIIVVCLALYLIQQLVSTQVFYWGALSYVDGMAFKQPWRLITYQYLHASAWHFAMNMLILYFFLPTLELRWGWWKALVFYTLGGIAGGLVFGIFSFFYRGGFLLGASGSVFAAMGAVALLYPNRQFLFGIPIRTGVAIIGFIFVLSAVADRSLGDAAHLGGLAFGFFAPLVAGPMVNRYRHKWQRRRMRREAEAEVREQESIDRILEKVSHEGMQSLTRSEKRTLQRATERQRRQESTRARRAY